MTRSSFIDQVAATAIHDLNGFDFDAVLNVAFYQPVVERKGNMTYQHETGATVTVLFDRDAGHYSSITASTPIGPGASADQVATVGFGGATPIGAVLALLLSPQWQAKCAQAAIDADDRRRARVAELEAELARLKAQEK